MLVNRVELSSGEDIFLLDDFFPVEQLGLLQTVTDRFTKDSEHWTASAEFCHHRWIYNSSEPEYHLVIDYAQSPELLNKLTELTGCALHFSHHTMWVDFAGMGALRPHYEQGGEFLVQVFITRKTDGTNGTTFYTNKRQVLFQLPYRNNLAWLFEGTKVLHGRQSDVAPGLV